LKSKTNFLSGNNGDTSSPNLDQFGPHAPEDRPEILPPTWNWTTKMY